MAPDGTRHYLHHSLISDMLRCHQRLILLPFASEVFCFVPARALALETNPLLMSDFVAYENHLNTDNLFELFDVIAI